jgi:orotate phosphoribosyltransferase
VRPNSSDRAGDILALVEGRRGHFAMESGYHGTLWLSLDTLFINPGRVTPFIRALAEQLAEHRVEAVCGPMVGGAFLAQRVAEELGVEFWYASRTDAPVPSGSLFGVRYAVKEAFASRARDRRVAVVDDVISAGSSIRATMADLEGHGATVPVVGALLVMGDVGANHLASCGLPVVAYARTPFSAWPPRECPRCAAGEPVERVGESG